MKSFSILNSNPLLKDYDVKFYKLDVEDKADSVHVLVTTDYGQLAVSSGIHTGTTYFPNGKVRYEWK